MINADILETLAGLFRKHFGRSHEFAAYAPGRVEVLGNHTDYNEGFVLSAAINFGTFFVLAPREDKTCRLVAGDLGEEASFEVDALAPDPSASWANYVIGVASGLQAVGRLDSGFDGMFLGNVPLGAGLSSSAALEMSSGLALSALYNIKPDKLDLARIGQKAEHDFAGTNCGLLDQISSLFARKDCLVMSDFRSLEVRDIPLGTDACFLMCNTRAAHKLVDGVYNKRRARCEEAASFFNKIIDRPIRALRDVTWDEWETYVMDMDPLAGKRAAHVIGENTRVLKGEELLARGDLAGFGELMFASHESSRTNFENSCEELDVIVEAAQKIPGALGARLSGGGFGGSAVVLVHPRDVDVVSKAIATSYEKELGHPCDIRTIRPSGGAEIVGT